MTTPAKPAPRDWRLVVVALVSGSILALGAGYVGAVLALSGDGAVIVLDNAAKRAQLVVTVREPVPGGLQTGDVVLSLGGRSPDEWLAEVWQPATVPLDVPALEYVVERNGQTLTLTQPLTRPAPLSLLTDLWSYVVYLLYQLLVAFVVIVRRRHLPAAQALLLLSCAVAGTASAYFLGLRPSDVRRGWMVVVYLWSSVPLYAIMAAGTVHFTLVFPRVRPVVRQRPWLVPALYLAAVVPFAVLLLARWSSAPTNMARMQLLLNAPDLIALSYFLLMVASAFWALRTTTDPVERRQIRWIAWSLAVGVLPWALLSVLPEVIGFPELLPDALTGLLWCALPTALAIAILRERLFDIDVLVNRTLVYGVLSGLLALVYFGAVVVLQSAVVLLTGQRGGQLVIVLSTLAMAAVASPLRARVQSVIDRRFYRRHYDAGRTLAAFGQAARTIVDLQPLSDQLVTVVQDTMEPVSVGLAWVRAPEAHATPAGSASASTP